MKILRSLGLALLGILLLTSAAAPPAAAPARGSALKAPLADTTLARILFSTGRAEVTLSQLRTGAYKLGARPDSLTPKETSQVLDLLVQQAILTHRVQQEPRSWNASDSSDYRLLEDRLTLTAALDSALAGQASRMAARGDSVPGRDELGIIVRDSTIAAMHPAYDESMFQMLAASFAARPKPAMDLPLMKRIEMSAAMPVVSRGDSAKVLLASRVDSITVGRLLTDLGRLSPTRRPEIHGAEDLRDLCNSRVYETLLRRAVRDQGLARQPRIARQLAERAQFLDVQRFVSTQVYDKIPVDSTTLRRHFASVRNHFQIPARAVVVRMFLERRSEADSLARKLTLPGFADSLIAKSSRAGVPYRTVIDERFDSLLFQRARAGGIGVVLGPDSVHGSWRVLKVMEIQAGRPQTFEEAYTGVRGDWSNVESERRMRELMSQLLAASTVNVNQASPYLTGRRRIPR